MAFVTAAELKAALAAFKRARGNAAADLAAAFDDICAWAAEDARVELTAVLTADGYRPETVAAWDDALTYSRRLGLFFCGVYGAANFSDKEKPLLNKLDCREAVGALASIVVNGKVVPPDAADPTIAGGRMEHGREVFARPYRTPRRPVLGKSDADAGVGSPGAVNPLTGVYLDETGLPYAGDGGGLILE